jgi:hypothetical protein
MKRIEEFAPPVHLAWKQPKVLKSRYELVAGSERVGTLHFSNSFGSLATGESADGTWTFKRVGFFRQVATIRTAGSEVDFAQFQNKTWSGGGSIVLPGGRKFLATTNTWETRFEWSLEGGGVLFRFKTGGIIRHTAEVEVTPAGAAAAEIPLLLLFSWYLSVMLARDSAATAASSASSG